MKLSNVLFFAMALAFASPAFANDVPAEVATAPEAKECLLMQDGAEPGAETNARSCQRCGDGYCAKSCENEFTCPQDCAGVES